MNSLQAKAFLDNLTPETTEEILRLLLKPIHITIVYDTYRLEWYDYYPGISAIFLTEKEQIDDLMTEIDRIHKTCFKELEGYQPCCCLERHDEEEPKEVWTREDVIKHFQEDDHYSILCTVWRRDVSQL